VTVEALSFFSRPPRLFWPRMGKCCCCGEMNRVSEESGGEGCVLVVFGGRIGASTKSMQGVRRGGGDKGRRKPKAEAAAVTSVLLPLSAVPPYLEISSAGEFCTNCLLRELG
jgi:hypothetical protein